MIKMSWINLQLFWNFKAWLDEHLITYKMIVLCSNLYPCLHKRNHVWSQTCTHKNESNKFWQLRFTHCCVCALNLEKWCLQISRGNLLRRVLFSLVKSLGGPIKWLQNNDQRHQTSIWGCLRWCMLVDNIIMMLYDVVMMVFI